MIRTLIKRIKSLDNIRKRYLTLTVSLLIIFFLILIGLFIVQIRIYEENHAIQKRDQILQTKMEVIRDTVNNTIDSIDKTRLGLEDYYKKRLKRFELFTFEKNSIQNLMDFLSNDDLSDDVISLITDDQGKIIFQTNNSKNLESVLINEDLDNLLLDKKIVNIEDYKLYVGVLNETIKQEVISRTRDRIYNDIYFEDAYMWINEVINYEGGENYGIRLIHPNLKETEGMFLSTNMTDVKGTTPYLTELEGIKKDGELFFNYYFKKLDTDSIEEKLTYAKLYKEYDWILAMGVYYDNINVFINEAEELSETQIKEALVVLALSGLVLIIIGLILFFRLERDYFNKSNIDLKEQIETDELTGARSRRSGMKRLELGFEDFTNKGENLSLLLLDIDDFKMINDTYGHDVGDQVLVKLVDTINRGIRESDTLYRWGGEEFLIVSKETSLDGLEAFISKVLSIVEKTDFNIENASILLSTSIGGTQFKKGDKSYNELIKRADNGLYESKRQGKNRGTIIL